MVVRKVNSIDKKYFAGPFIEFQSICHENGSWSNVDYSCRNNEDGFYSIAEIGSNSLIILIVGIFLIIIIASVVLATTIGIKW